MDISTRLVGVIDKGYADFNKKISMTGKKVLGVRVPDLRTIAKEYSYEEIKRLDMDVYEHAMMLGFSVCTLEYEEFLKELPFVLSQFDSWAHTDSMIANVKRYKKHDLESDFRFLLGKGVFFDRFYINSAMDIFPKSKTAMERIAQIDTTEYYIAMAIAWYCSVLMTLDLEEAIKYTLRFDDRVVKMALRKGLDSRRLSAEQKARIRVALKKD